MVPLLVITPYDQPEAQKIITSGNDLRQNDVGRFRKNYRGRGRGGVALLGHIGGVRAILFSSQH